MKIYNLFIILFIISGCSSSEPIRFVENEYRIGSGDLCNNSIYISRCDLFSFNDSLQFNGKASHYSEYNSFKFFKVTGKVALNKKDEKSTLKIGEWTTYYDNEEIRSKGSYAMGRYLQCCFSGPCVMYYDYKTGPWTFWSNNGNKKAEGTYNIIQKHISTSCKGGAYMKYGRVDKEKWKFWDNEGNIIADSDSLINHYQEVAIELKK